MCRSEGLHPFSSLDPVQTNKNPSCYPIIRPRLSPAHPHAASSPPDPPPHPAPRHPTNRRPPWQCPRQFSSPPLPPPLDLLMQPQQPQPHPPPAVASSSLSYASFSSSSSCTWSRREPPLPHLRPRCHRRRRRRCPSRRGSCTPRPPPCSHTAGVTLENIVESKGNQQRHPIRQYPSLG